MTNNANSDNGAEKRRLRLAIARSRRRINHRIGNSGAASRRLASWRTYARRWPAAALAAGLGLGWILAAGLRPRFLLALFSGPLIRQVTGRVTDLLFDEAKRFWSDAAPDRDAAGAEGGDDG